MSTAKYGLPPSTNTSTGSVSHIQLAKSSVDFVGRLLTPHFPVRDHHKSNALDPSGTLSGVSGTYLYVNKESSQTFDELIIS